MTNFLRSVSDMLTNFAIGSTRCFFIVCFFLLFFLQKDSVIILIFMLLCCSCIVSRGYSFFNQGVEKCLEMCLLIKYVFFFMWFVSSGDEKRDKRKRGSE